MIGGLVEIAEDGRHLSLHRGFLIVRKAEQELGRVPLDDITGLVLSARQTSLSRNIMAALAERKAIIVICGDQYEPISITWPFQAHHRAAAVLRSQIETSRPLQKRLWQSLVQTKIAAQIAALESHGGHKAAAKIAPLIRLTRSGDPDNREAQAARLYWPALMGENFRRDRTVDGINSLLNYGYTILRSATARAICGAGLHPALGLHHGTDVNSFALVDDLMEPFRPLVDHYVKNISDNGDTVLSPDIKRQIAIVLQHDLLTPRGVSPLINVLARLAQSLTHSLEEGENLLEIAELGALDRLV